MKERPILMSGPMVVATLDGRKTQTRRVVSFNNSSVLGYRKKSIWDRLHHWENAWVDGESDKATVMGNGEYLHVPWTCASDSPVTDDEEDWCWARVRSIWEPGNVLWVREKWKPDHSENEIRYMADLTYSRHLDRDEWFKDDWIKNRHRTIQVRPSIHMPRWASRLSLLIKDVRVERLQDISLDDINAEGVGNTTFIDHHNATGHFHRLWQSINGKKHPWSKNPWVWVIDYEVKR